MITALEIAASLTTIAQIWLYGEKTVWGPAMGMISAVFFWAYMIMVGAWGLLPLNIVALGLHGWNLRKWLRGDR